MSEEKRAEAKEILLKYRSFAWNSISGVDCEERSQLENEMNVDSRQRTAIETSGNGAKKSGKNIHKNILIPPQLQKSS